MGEIGPHIGGDQGRDRLAGRAGREPCPLLAGDDPRRHRVGDAGEISINGYSACRSRHSGSSTAAPQRSANVADLSSIFPEGVAGNTLSNSTSGRPSGPIIGNALSVGIRLGRTPRKRGSAGSTASSISSSSLAWKHGSVKPKRAARRRKISVLGNDSPSGAMTGSARCSQ